MEKIKFGLVGSGHIGKRHAAVIDNNDSTELTGYCDIELSRAKNLAKTYDCDSFFQNYEDLLKCDVDVISICSPHYLHKQMALLAISANKHVLVEKPMALNSSDAKEMSEKASKAGVKLFVVKQNRFNVPIVFAEEALRNNRLGKIFMVNCNVLWNRNQEYYDQSDWHGVKEREGGALFTQASHFIDILVWWFGKLESASSVFETQFHDIEIEDCGSSSLKFESGVIGNLAWTTNVYSKNYEGSITVIGEYGTIKIGGAYLNKIEYWDVRSYPLPENLAYVDQPNNYGKYQGSSSNHHRVLEEVVKDLRGEQAATVQGQEGELSIAAIEKIYNGAI